MIKREKCRNCEAVLKHDKASDQYDPEYCSAKCRVADGAERLPESEATSAAIDSGRVATLEDYKKRSADYCRRFEPERLNWGAPLNAPQLKQAGLRANRQPIPGDWDFEVKESENVQEPK